MKKIINETQSLCPECLKKIPARHIEENGKVFLEKECPEHGRYQVLVWSDAKQYWEWTGQSIHAEPCRTGPEPCRTGPEPKRGCPFDCGLCGAHEGKTCTAVLELTYRCNMECEVCFADTKKERYEPGLAEIGRMYETAYRNGGDCSIQLSGGEPTVRNDLPEILRMGKRMGFSHIQVNTNGIRIAEDPDYLQELKAAGADLVYLQFDSLRDQVYREIRGRNMLDIKLRAVSNCERAGIGVILVPVLVKGLNDGEAGDLIAYAKKHMPIVKGVHFQPISYFGRYPNDQGRLVWDRMNLSDVISCLTAQTDGEMKEKDFVPRKRYDSHCAFSALYFLEEDGRLKPVTENTRNKQVTEGTDFARRANAFTNKHWKLQEPEAPSMDGRGSAVPGQPERRSMKEFIRRLKNYTLSVSGMGFQDAYNIDIGRLKGCCVHVITYDGQAVPLCAFHLTGLKGGRLYKNE